MYINFDNVIMFMFGVFAMVPVVIDVQGVEIEPNDCPLEKELNLKLTINASQKVSEVHACKIQSRSGLGTKCAVDGELLNRHCAC